jgi:hypothetical protein
MDSSKLGLFFIAFLLLSTLAVLTQADLAYANPSIPPDIPPIVTVSNMNLNATVFVRDNQLWASIDAEYVTDTVHGYGESFYIPKKGVEPQNASDTYKITVVTDMLEADYPMLPNATNISVKVNGEEKEWYHKEQSIFHLYGSDMKRIGWITQPAPKDFTINVHYEHPLIKTSDTETTLILPLGQRYGSTEAPYYPLYDWYGFTSIDVSMRLQTEISDLPFEFCSVYSNGSVTPLTSNALVDGASTIQTVEFTTTAQTQFPLGIVILTQTNENTLEQQPQNFEPTLLVVLTAVLIIVGAGLSMMLYRRKNSKRTVS